MLCNTASLCICYACVTDCVKKRCLTVVNVTHYNNYRRTRNKIFRLIFFLRFNHKHIFFCKNNFLFNFNTEIVTDKLCCFKVDSLVL